MTAPREAYPRAKAAALKALEVDETLAEAHVPLGAAGFAYEWDWVGAEKELKRAIELNPSYASAHNFYAQYLMFMGRHNEAIAEIKRAHDSDPLSPINNTVGGMVFFFARRYDEAIAECQRALELNAGFYPAHLFLAEAYEQERLHDKAISEYRKAIALQEGSTRAAAGLARGYAAVGRRTEALKIISDLRQLSKQRYVSAYGITQTYIALGDFDHAWAWLEKAYRGALVPAHLSQSGSDIGPPALRPSLPGPPAPHELSTVRSLSALGSPFLTRASDAMPFRTYT